ncbi:uncharacterized protein [Typha latifolia]|uniref:uncharacterized protein n=1 Tax=Typha latifolia TaxID=4733 RepID=UPI003C302E93
MRTRNADTPKSAAAKKTPPTKKDAAVASAEKTPEVSAPKSTPKSTPRSGPKTAKGKQAAAKAAAAAAAAAAASAAAVTPIVATPQPTPEPNVEEAVTPSDGKKHVSAVKSPEKKAGGKAKSPPGAGRAEEIASKVEVAKEAASEAKPEKITEEAKEEVEEEPKMDMAAATDAKDEMESGPAENSEEKDPAGDEQMVEVGGHQEVVAEQAAEELVDGAEEGEGEEGVEGGEGDEREGDEAGVQVEVDEQMEISDMAQRRKIKKEQEIFVGGLDRDAVEEDIKKVFEQIGEVVEVRLHKDFVTNKNKGFAFVKFSSKEQAARAIVEMKNPVIRGKRCGIAPSEDNDTLFLGNICNTWTKEAIKRKLQDYGVDGVEHITLVADTQNEGLSRGFAFLEFSCHADAMLAYKRLQKPDVIFGHPERTAKVAFAEPLREPDPEVMAQVKSVFVDGLPPYWDEDRVKEQFKGYGEIERVVLARNMSTAKRNDFGFVNFSTHEAAVACVEGINNMELGDGKTKIKARARLANPLPKTQAVKGGMSGGFRIGYSGMGFNRFGRGYSRGRFSAHRAGFQGGRGFNLRGRGRGGRFLFAADNNLDSSPSDFRGRRPFQFRGGRWGSTSGGRGAFERGHGAFERGHGRGFPSRRPPFPPEGDFGSPFGATHLGEDPYFYGNVGHGNKRPFSMMEHDSGYLEPGSRLRPRFDHPDPLSGGSRYRDSLGMGGLYSRDYFGSDYGGRTYSSLYRGGHSGGGYYY